MKEWIIALMVAIVIAFIGLVYIAGIPQVNAGDKEEIQAKLVALLQEERAMNAEFELYKAKMGELQNRLPNLRKEKDALTKQLKAIEDKEKAAAKPAPAKPATTGK